MDNIDEMLYMLMPKIEERMLATIPSEKDLQYDFSLEFEKKMRRLIRSAENTMRFNGFVAPLRRVLAVVAVIAAIIIGGALSVAAVRNALFNKITIVYKELTEVYFTRSGKTDQAMIYAEPGYIPKRFTKDTVFENIIVLDVIYKAENGDVLYYDQSSTENLVRAYDSEGAEIRNIVVKGTEVVYFENKGYSYAYFEHEAYSYSLHGNATEREILKIIKSILK